MILWCDGAHDAPENMRRDQAMWERAENSTGGFEPLMRLFQFQPAGITLGRCQIPEDELNVARCHADGVQWAIRPTGGRAIFHAEEWTYSFAARLDDDEWGGPPRETYERLSRLLLASLAALGVSAELSRASAAQGRPRGRGEAAPPCFASTARLELGIGGRKLAGSAQRRGARAYLQQGSVLLSDGHLRLIDYLRVPEARREPMRAALAAAATHAGAMLGPQAPLSLWERALLERSGVRMRRPATAPLTHEAHPA